MKIVWVIFHSIWSALLALDVEAIASRKKKENKGSMSILIVNLFVSIFWIIYSSIMLVK